MQKQCIILDDLGSEIADINSESQVIKPGERVTSFTAEQSFKFIDGCNIRNIALIVTTNLASKDFKKITAENASNLTYARMYSRILEKCFPIQVNKVTRRSSNTQRNKANMETILGLKK